jgi:hypothetical protein
MLVQVLLFALHMHHTEQHNLLHTELLTYLPAGAYKKTQCKTSHGVTGSFAMHSTWPYIFYPQHTARWEPPLFVEERKLQKMAVKQEARDFARGIKPPPGACVPTAEFTYLDCCVRRCMLEGVFPGGEGEGEN